MKTTFIYAAVVRIPTNVTCPQEPVRVVSLTGGSRHRGTICASSSTIRAFPSRSTRPCSGRRTATRHSLFGAIERPGTERPVWRDHSSNGHNDPEHRKDFWVCWTLDALFNGLAPSGPRLRSLGHFRGIANSRLKDFYDLWLIAQTCKFRRSALVEARAVHVRTGRRTCRSTCQ